jgi:lipopolysaccharide export system protein LptA
VRQGRTRRSAPALVSATIQQQSANFSYSDVEQGRTVFTVRASHATQFKDQNRALLEDVWITIYGKAGDRDDNIHTRECSYQPLTGAIRCAGAVQINVQGNIPAAANAADETLEVKTSDISFNRETGEASSTQPVEFRFRAGRGRGVGILYRTHDSIMRIEHTVEFELDSQSRAGGLPVNATGHSLEIRRDDRVAVLEGEARVRQGDREVTADRISVVLDQNDRAQRAIAEGHPVIHAADGKDKLSMSANRFDAFLGPQGWVERIIADGKIIGTRQGAGESDRFASAHAEVAMLPQGNLAKEVTATGGVSAESQRGSESHILKTDSVRLTFAARGSANSLSKQQSSRQRLETAETLAPATLESRNGSETTSLRAQRLVAELGPDGKLDRLLGHSGVEVRRQGSNEAAQTGSAAELIAKFGANGDWDTIDESGNVRFQQGDQQASAARAHIVRGTRVAVLQGDPIISDSISRTTTSVVAINQQSGEVQATGGVVSTYIPGTEGSDVGLGSGVAHVTADSLTGSTTSGHFVYSGHARLWQGESVLEAEQIDFWRDDKKLQAKGQVQAIFQQASGPSGVPAGPGPSSHAVAGPALWKVHAPLLTYWSDQAKARMEGGVTASSDQGLLASRTLDVFLNPSEAPSSGVNPSSTSLKNGSKPEADRRLSRVVAQGGVVVRQGDRRGVAEQAEYTAADGKFVLSGGKPTLTNAASDTTTGRSLTFFVANDTILVDSQEGSRTLTKHRVEK